MMYGLDRYELEVLRAYESGKLKPVAGKVELKKMRAAARSTSKLSEGKAAPSRR